MVSLRERPPKPSTPPARVSKRIQTKKPEPKASVKTKSKPKKPERKLLYRKTEPLFLECPKTGEKVWITTANIQDIRQAEKKGKSPFNASRKYLVKVNAPNAREEAYDRAAQALERWEEQLLPTYGGRPWKVQVRVQDPLPTETKAAQKYPYFRFYKGMLEIAAWPHIVEKIPEPPRFPGFSTSSSSNRQSSRGVSAGDETTDDCFDEESISVEDKSIQKLQEREPSVISEMALQERWRVPLPRISTKWISPLRETFNTRKSAWERAVELCKQEITIDKALLGVGGNGKPLKSKSLSRKTVLEAGRLRFERDGLWVVGQEEGWQRDRSLLDSTDTASSTAKPTNRKLTGLAYFLQCRRKEHRDARLKELGKVGVPKMACYVVDLKVEGQDASLQSEACDKNPSFPACATLEHEPNKSSVKETAPIEGGQRSVAADETTECLNLPGKLYNDNATNGENLLSNTVNEQNLSNAHVNDFDRKSSGAAATSEEPSLCTKPQYLKPTKETSADKISFTLREAETELRVMWKTLSDEERKDWEIRANAFSCMANNETEDTPTQPNTQSVRSSPSQSSERHVNDSVPLPKAATGDSVSEADSLRIVTPSCSQNSSRASPCMRSEELKGTLSRKNISSPLFDGHSKKFCLNEDQIKLCHEACVTHYEQIMRTVRVRDLARELQGGFDLFRERGRGRFDMELPIFETPEFGFLTDLKKAPWMPVVKEILGKEVCLIHKGIFLAMPGAEKQNYHQDGIHLTSQYQKPCHAINVFVPLVDLTNQGTEFCLGSHILGNEDLDNNFLYTPTVTAGTPIVFDYRLGHRGLANTSGSIRPVVYCTYAAAADGNEFRDSVNFSRKRYKPIGDLVSKAPSREERAKKRGKIIESVKPPEALDPEPPHDTKLILQG